MTDFQARRLQRRLDDLEVGILFLSIATCGGENLLDWQKLWPCLIG